jgi:hypothetical protein
MKNLVISILSTLALTAASVAHAGAVGGLVTSGMHQERAYFYSRQLDQSIEKQMRSNYGLGIEALVGDKDEKIQGILRFMWMVDAPPKSPDMSEVVLAQSPDYEGMSPNHIGVLGLGVQWGLLGDPTEKQLVLTTLVGSGFITRDNTEYALAEIGIGGTYNLSSTVQATANMAVTARLRKHGALGPNMYLGMRYLFD